MMDMSKLMNGPAVETAPVGVPPQNRLRGFISPLGDVHAGGHCGRRASQARIHSLAYLSVAALRRAVVDSRYSA